ncbi:MAG: Methyltransferase domain-containing protein [Candidatus Electronema aureum]|uniref:Arsenite methyltransferase n=1 Tax=Candidatus Electronema aureum TaxID=2005002 RepID=A0A521G286_9BACT|nr:MAG: Methyltransferase domain-containing protein [Candidatus Electronema aureum]
MSDQVKDALRAEVRARYGGIAVAGGSCCGASQCAPQPLGNPLASASVGYAAEEMAAVPDGANMGLGCGNPQAIAELQAGETVLDLGSGGGFDCFLAARQVGAAGRVIGVDMTPEMLAKARDNARKGGYANVEFRLGEIEHLPVADSSVDVIISNCVINLSPDKAQVFAETCRVLRPGGRLAISDVVAVAPLPPELGAITEAYTCCAAGAAPVAEIEAMLKQAGFSAVSVEIKEDSRAFIKDWMADSGIENYIRSAVIIAEKS